MIEQTFAAIIKTKLQNMGFDVYSDYPDKNIEELGSEIAFLNFEGLKLEEKFRGLSTGWKYYVYNLKCSVRLYTSLDLVTVCSELADSMIKYRIVTHIKPEILPGSFDNILGRVQGNIEFSAKAIDKAATTGG